MSDFIMLILAFVFTVGGLFLLAAW